MYDAVLLPTDGSDAAAGAVDHAIDLAEQYGASLHVVHVVESIPEAEATSEDIVAALERTGADAVQDIVDRATAAGLTDVSQDTLHGAPHEAILDYVDDHGIDIVVMGTHGRTGLDRYILGSVTEKLVRMADVPVLTVRTHDD